MQPSIAENSSPKSMTTPQIEAGIEKKDTSNGVIPVTSNNAIADKKAELDESESFYMDTQEEGASVNSSIINMMNTIIGAGTLSLPMTVYKGGIIGAGLLLVLSLILSLIGAHFLSMASIYTKGDSYGAISKKLSSKGVSVIADVSMIIFDFGISVAYCSIIFQQVVDLGISWVHIDPTVMAESKKWVALVISVVVLFPILCIPTIDALKFTSAISLTCIALFVVISIYLGITQVIKGGLSYHMWPRDISAFSSAVSVFFTCFCSHVNIPKMTAELKLPKRTKFANKMKKMDRIDNISFTLCTVVYYSVGLCGYLAYGDNVKGSLLDSFAETNATYLNIVKLAYCLIVLFSYPVLSFSPLVALDKMIFHQPRPTWRRIVEAAIWTALCLVIALLIPSLEVIFGITGSLCGIILVIAWPSIFYIWIGKLENAKAHTDRVPMFHVSKGMIVFAWALFYVGILAAIFFTVLQVKDSFKL